ncbi:MAG: hypothetical protein R3Y08_07955 [Rikenellaceae bacterium]
MNNFFKIIAMFVAFATTVGCSTQKWEEVPVDYTPIYSIMPYKGDIYEFKVYHQRDRLSIWNTYATIVSYNTIVDLVDNSAPKGEDEMFYDISFTEIKETSTLDENGDTVTTSTEYNYTIVENEDNRNYVTMTITNTSTGAVTTYEKATLKEETIYIDYE